jgi:hypothetical protein
MYFFLFLCIILFYLRYQAINIDLASTNNFSIQLRYKLETLSMKYFDFNSLLEETFSLRLENFSG